MATRCSRQCVTAIHSGYDLRTEICGARAGLGACRALGRACVEAGNGLSLGAQHSHAWQHGAHGQRRMAPKIAPALRVESGNGLIRRCECAPCRQAWLCFAPRLSPLPASTQARPKARQAPRRAEGWLELPEGSACQAARTITLPTSSAQMPGTIAFTLQHRQHMLGIGQISCAAITKQPTHGD